MAIAAEALLRLKAVLDDEGFRKAEGALRGLDNQAKRTGGTIGGRVNRPLDRMRGGLERLDNSRPMQAVNRGLVATGAGLGLAVKAAVDFENEFSGVRKQLGVDIKSPILDTYRRQLLDLSTKTPTPVATLARIATEGAKIGLRGNPLMEYVNRVQMASKAMEIPAEELVGSFNGINAALQLKPREGYKLLDVINAIDDKLPANVNSRQLLEGMSRVGSIPRVAGVKPQNTAAMLATIIGQNFAPEMAATGVKNFLTPLAGGSISLSKDKKNVLAQIYGYDDPGVRFLNQQKKTIEGEITSLQSKIDKGGGLMGKKGLAMDKARLKELKAQLKGIKQEIKDRPGSADFGGKVANYLKNRMQVDDRGTILEVLNKINALPKADRLGVVQELFGRESGAQIMAMVGNVDLLKQGMQIGDAELGGQISSVKKEYDALLQGAPAQLEMFKNSLMAPAIEIGRTLLPALLEVTRAMKPMIDGFTDFVRKNPEAVTKFVQIAGAVAGLKIAMMGLGVVVSVLQGVGTAIRGLGTAATFLVNLPRTIAGTLGAVGPLLQKLKGLGTGGGMFAGIISAAKGLAGRVMGPIRSLVGMIRIAFAGLTFRELFPGLANRLQQLKGTVARIFGKGAAQGAIGGAANNIRPTVLRPMNNIRPFTRIPPIANPLPWVGNVATALRGILPVLALVGRTLLGVFTGPVGWVTLLIGAGVALYAFRNQIGQFVASVGPALAGVFAPLRNLAGGLMTAISTSLANLGTMLAPVWAGIAAAFRTYVVTPIQQVWNFLVVWIGQTIAAYAIVWWRGVVQGFNVYVVQPIQMAWGYLLQALALAVQGLATVWAGISQAFNTYVVRPVQTAWNGLVGFFGQGVAYLRGILSQVWAGVSAAFVQWVVTPITQAWNQLVGLFNATTGPLRTALSSAWQGVAENFNQYVVQPVSRLWSGLTTFVGNAAGGMVRAFQGAWQGVAGAVMNGVITPLQNMFNGLASRIRSIFDGLLGWARGIGNFIVDRVNPVRQAAGFQPLQRFAKGGYVNGPTLGLIGEGRDPREYIIPERKMAGASMNYLSGKRGASVLSGVPRFAKGGYVKAGRSWTDSSEWLRDLEFEKEKRKRGGRYTIEQYVKDNKIPTIAEYAKQQKLPDLMEYAKQNNIPIIGYPNVSSYQGKKPKPRAPVPARSFSQRSPIQSNSGMGSFADLMGMGQTGLDIDGPGLMQGMEKQKQAYILRMQREGEQIEAIVKQQQAQQQELIGQLKDSSDAFSEVLGRAKQMLTQVAYDRGISLPSMDIPGFARGGYVNKPTLGLIGEAGDNEYVIPERRMAASAMAFLSGARGMDVINPPRFANGGVVGSSMANRSGNLNALLERTGAIGGQTVVVQEPQVNATIQVSTGDVLQFEGQQYVTLSDYQRGLKQVQSETLGLLRTAQGRRATGR